MKLLTEANLIVIAIVGRYGQSPTKNIAIDSINQNGQLLVFSVPNIKAEPLAVSPGGCTPYGY